MSNVRWDGNAQSSHLNESQQADSARQRDLFVDVVRGGHISASSKLLLEKRRLIWTKDYGWVYDVWVDDPKTAALAGANGRFSLPGIAEHLGRVASDGLHHVKIWCNSIQR